MGLIANRSIQKFVLGTQFGASASYKFREIESPYSLNSNRFFGGFSKEFGTPAGYHAPYSIVQPLSDGGITGVGSATGSGTATGYAGRFMTADGSATGSGSANVDAVTNIIADGSATGSGSADVGGVVNIVADGSASGSGSVDMGAIINLLASGSASGSGSVTLTALANIIAEGGGGSELSPENLASSLLDEADIETGYSMREALRLILSSAAGKLSGAETTTITIKNVVDDKNRIVATVDANGNRTSVTYDVSDS